MTEPPKVVLLAINSKYIHSSLSVWALASGMEQYAHAQAATVVIEATINQDIDAIVCGVVAHAPAVVGISSYIWNARLLPEVLCRLRKALPHADIVLGGPEAAFNAEHWLHMGADYVLRGEGERSFPALVDALLGKTTPKGIPGLCRMVHGRFEANAPEVLQVPPDPFSPVWQRALRGRIAYVETSRGCPFACAFCLSGKDSVRFFPMARAKRQLTELAASGAQTIKLVDRTFNCDAGRAYELFEYVINMDTGCCFHFEVAADLFDERTIALLRTAPPGRIQLEAGLQSFHEPTLQAVSRRTDIQKAARNIRTLLAAGNIHIHVDLIAGLPLETFDEFQNSFDNAYALGPHQLQLGFLKLLHGSALRAQAARLGLRYSEQPPYEITENPWISAAELDTLRMAEDALEHAYNSGRFLRTLGYVLAASGMRPFELYLGIGEHAAHGGIPLELYAERLFEHLSGMAGIDRGRLRDEMLCDLLASARGEGVPQVLRGEKDARQKLVAGMAAEYRGRKVPRCEAVVLCSRDQGVFVGEERSAVSGRFPLHFVELSVL